MWNFGVTGSIDHLQEVRNSSYEYHRGRIDSQGPSDISIGGWDGPLSGVFLSEVSIGSIGEQWSKGIVAWKWKNGIGWFATKNTKIAQIVGFPMVFPCFPLDHWYLTIFDPYPNHRWHHRGFGRCSTPFGASHGITLECHLTELTPTSPC